MTGTEFGEAPRTAEEWRDFLAAYGRLYAENEEDDEFEDAFEDAFEAGDGAERGGQEEQAARTWRGAGPVGEEGLLAAEQRLGTRLPAGLRAFLSVTDGWEGIGGWVDRVLPCAQIDWFRDTAEGARLVERYPEDVHEPDPGTLFRRALLVAAGEDYWLLDPAETGPDGEWAAYEFQPKYGELDGCASFAELFQDSASSWDD